MPEPYNPVIAFLAVDPCGMKTHVHSETCTQMFRAAVVIIAPTGNSPRVLQHVTVGQAVALSDREEPNSATHSLRGVELSGEKS